MVAARTLARALVVVTVGLGTSGCGGCGGMIAPEDADDVDVDADVATPSGDAGALDATASDATSIGDAADAGGPDAKSAADSGGDAALLSGVLDLTFAGTGYVTRSGTASPGATHPDEIGYGVAVDSLGRVVVGGASQGPINYRAVVWRLDSAGAFDATFGSSGAWVSPAPPQNTDTFGLSVAVDATGRPLLVGSFWPSYPGAPAMSAWRLTANGVLDTSFNGTGQALAVTSAGGAYGTAVMYDQAGTPIVAGLGNQGGSPNGTVAQAMVWRLTTAGASDPSFGSDGGFALSAGVSGYGYERGQGAAVDSSGNVVVVGTALGGGALASALWRFTSTGALDTSFGGTGYVSFANLSGTNVETVYGVAVDALNRILFCGRTMHNLPQPRGFVARVTSTGVLDPTFGQDGILLLDPPAAPESSARGLTIDSQGRIVVAGVMSGLAGASAAVWRLTSTGVLDTSFGSLGRTPVNVPGYFINSAYAVAVDQTDRAVVSGFTAKMGSSYHDMLVFRLTP